VLCRRSITLDRELVLFRQVDTCTASIKNLLVAHVRTSDVRAVVEADATPEKVLMDFKVISSRALNEIEGTKRKRVRHGRTRYLWTKPEIDRAVHYVVARQGVPMAVYEAHPRVPG
jgi:hypothetical protein